MQKMIFMVQGALQSIWTPVIFREIVLAELSELTDSYPLLEYKCGTLQMVTLKRSIYVW